MMERNGLYEQAAAAGKADQPHRNDRRPGGADGRPPRILFVTAVEAERQAVLNGWPEARAIAAGVGPANAAAATAFALAEAECDLVVSIGIGGGFPGRAEIGSLVLADAIVAADLGAESPDGFIGLDKLGFGTAAEPVDLRWHARLKAALESEGLAVLTGTALTVSTATGTAETAALRAKLAPEAAVEGMEGSGAAAAARMKGIPAAELRAVSNPVGPRDRGAWRIAKALQALETAAAAFRKHLA